VPTPAAIRRIAVLDAPSNLGLRPPADRREPGAARMAATLRQHGLMARTRADDAGAVAPPAYRADPDPESGFRNGPGIAAFTQILADRVGRLVDDGFLPVVLGGDCSVMLGPMLALRRLTADQLTTSLNCNQLVELVTAFLDGVLDADTERQVVEHLANCDGCHRYLEQIKATIRSLGELPPGSLTKETRASLLDAVRDMPQ
jgi:hypothetical protein